MKGGKGERKMTGTEQGPCFHATITRTNCTVYTSRILIKKECKRAQRNSNQDMPTIYIDATI